MKSHYTKEQRIKIVKERKNGKTVKEICREYEISRTTYYNWEKLYIVKKTTENKIFTYRDIQILEQRNQKLENIIDIYNKSGCTQQANLDEKIKVICLLQDEYSIHTLCKAFGILRSTYYHRLRASKTGTKTKNADILIKKEIKKILEDSKYRMGSRKIKVKLNAIGIKVSDKRIRRLLLEMDIQIKKPVKQKRMYNRKKSNQYFVNRLKQEFKQEKPNKVWVSDTTHLRIKEEKFYLCVIIDLFSRKAIAHKLSRFHDVNLIMDTFQLAYVERDEPINLMFHSDQGSQYTAYQFREQLRKLGIIQSFSKPGYPYDNAVVESFFSVMKREEINVNEYHEVRELTISIDEYIEYYNSYRPHQSLDYKTPVEMEAKFYKNAFS